MSLDVFIFYEKGKGMNIQYSSVGRDLCGKTNLYADHILAGKVSKFTATICLAAEALRLGCTITKKSRTDLKVSLNGQDACFNRSRSRKTTSLAHRTAKDKEKTKQHLVQAGVPVAQGRLFNESESKLAREFAQQIGFPVVLKPNKGRQGI